MFYGRLISVFWVIFLNELNELDDGLIFFFFQIKNVEYLTNY